MAKTKAQKQDTIKQLEDCFSKMKSVVFSNFDNLSVHAADALRNDARDNNVSVIVAKKTLLKRAIKNSRLDSLSDFNFEGGIASFFSFGDETVGARTISTFAKEHQGLKMLGGIVDGIFYDEVKIHELAKLPSKETLLAQVVGTIEAPISGFVHVLSANIRNVVYTLNAIKETK